MPSARTQVVHFVLGLLVLLLAGGCAPMPPAQAPPPHTRLVLVLVGGNSEALHHGGIWGMYKGKGKAADSVLISSIRDHTGLRADDIASYYYSWTGDDESRRRAILPGHWDWIVGGGETIENNLKHVLDAQRARKLGLVIVGWSNGGATAYELACRLALSTRVDLLVTLDPVAYSTAPCADYNDGTLATPAPWINVYTRSSGLSRLRAGNIAALLGRAWNAGRLPSRPTSNLLLAPADHGDVCRMWKQRVLTDGVFARWAGGLAGTGHAARATRLPARTAAPACARPP